MLAGASLLAGCSDDLFNNGGAPDDSNRINLSGEIDQLAVTRVNDNGFCDGDVIGVYIVDYDGNTPGTLQFSTRALTNGARLTTSTGKTSTRPSTCMATILTARPKA